MQKLGMLMLQNNENKLLCNPHQGYQCKYQSLKRHPYRLTFNFEFVYLCSKMPIHMQEGDPWKL